MPSPQSGAKVVSDIETEVVDGRVLITSMRGFITASVCEAAFTQFRLRAMTVTGAPWIIDTLAITGFQPGAVQVGARWFDVFRQQGGAQIIMVADSSAVRMAAATLAFAIHIKVSSWATLTEAYAQAGVDARSVNPSAYSFPPRAKQG